MAIRIDGKAVSAELREQIRMEAQTLEETTGTVPGLAVILVGDDPASTVYVRNKKKACEQCGFYAEQYDLPSDTSEEELLSLIDRLNGDEKIHGILVQLPLPRGLDAEKVLLRISPEKDVDAFHPFNVGRIMIGNAEYLPCTPAGIMELLRHTGIDPAGKECVIVGRSNIVGKPLAMLMLAANATVTVCHSKTRDLAEVTRRADILAVAIGKAEMITADMVKEGAVVIDVGMDRRADGSLCGDVKYDEVEPKVSAITPVPGGVGPMTITMLMKNTLTAAKHFAGTV